MTTLPELFAQMRAVDAGHWADAVADALSFNTPVAYIPQWSLDQIRTDGYGSVSCLGYNGPRANFSTPLVPVYLAPPQVDEAELIGGRTIVGWLRGEKFMPALPTDNASNFMNLGYEPVILVPPSTTFALPEA